MGSRNLMSSAAATARATRPGGEASFALNHVRRHGAPFVILVDTRGAIYAADRREGWRDLVRPLHNGSGQRIPDRLLALVEQHRHRCGPSGSATITLLDADVVVAVITLDGPWELFACSIAHVKREATMAEAQKRYDLTNREVELLELILRGEQSAEIGRALSISLATVEWHTKRLLLKTLSQNRTQMAARVLGWVCDTD
jgi:DNA-binding CsgD family transcriptional regulator